MEIAFITEDGKLHMGTLPLKEMNFEVEVVNPNSCYMGKRGVAVRTDSSMKESFYIEFPGENMPIRFRSTEFKRLEDMRGGDTC